MLMGVELSVGFIGDVIFYVYVRVVCTCGEACESAKFVLIRAGGPINLVDKTRKEYERDGGELTFPSTE